MLNILDIENKKHQTNNYQFDGPPMNVDDCLYLAFVSPIKGESLFIF
jgi:hypothetical protein